MGPIYSPPRPFLTPFRLLSFTGFFTSAGYRKMSGTLRRPKRSSGSTERHIGVGDWTDQIARRHGRRPAGSYQNGLLKAAFLIDRRDDEQLLTVMSELKGRTPEASMTFVGQSNSLGG